MAPSANGGGGEHGVCGGGQLPSLVGQVVAVTIVDLDAVVIDPMPHPQSIVKVQHSGHDLVVGTAARAPAGHRSVEPPRKTQRFAANQLNATSKPRYFLMTFVMSIAFTGPPSSLSIPSQRDTTPATPYSQAASRCYIAECGGSRP